MMKRPAAFTCLRRTLSSVTAAATSKVDIRRLRDAKPADQAVLLRQALASPTANNTAITNQLLNSVASGSLPDLPVRTWLSIAKDPRVTVAVVCQPHSATLRRLAMPVLTAHLRRDDTFEPTWDALGGSEGIVKLLSQLSITDLRLFLRTLRGTALARGETRDERQRRVGELFIMLNDVTKNPDKRPLSMEYAQILPSCPPGMALAWTDPNSANGSVPLKWTTLLAENHGVRRFVWKRLNKAHWDTIAEMEFQKSFSASEEKVDWEKLRSLVARSRTLRLKAFHLLAASKDFHGAPIMDVMERVILPLARQYSRRRSDPKIGSEFWALLIHSMKRSPALFKYDNVPRVFERDMDSRHERSLSEYVVRAWGHTALSDTELAAYLQALSERDSIHLSVEGILKQVRAEKRYTLLRLFLKHSRCYELDIGPPSNLKSDMLKKLKISVEVFLLLPGPEAVNLFERLQDAHPGYGYSGLEPWTYQESDLGNLFHLSLNHEDESLNPDGSALRGFLLHKISGTSISCPTDPRHVRNHLRVTELSRRKSLAQQGRTAELRAFWAVAACRLCIAMGDLDAYINTLIWARRFNKDALVLKFLYNDQQLHIPHLLNLLSAMNARSPTAKSIHQSVHTANKILVTLLETAEMTVESPSFCRSDWQSAYQLIPTVAELRLKNYRVLQLQMKWSDAQVFDAILQPTLDMLIEAETLILRSGNQRLGFQNPNGLSLFSKSDTKLEFTPLVVRFLDTLAERRDKLWASHRARFDPEVLKLGQPWPMGLPIQCLWPEHHIDQAADAPYLQTRAKNVVFCDPQVALSAAPTCPKAQASIGVFVDDWTVALRLYSSCRDDDSDYETRISSAWDYAIEELTGGRMSTEEAHRFWAPLFPYSASIAKVVNGDVPRRHYAPVPKVESDDPSHPVEWDPDPTYNAVTAYRKDQRYLGEATALDCMLRPGWKVGTHWTRRRLTWMKPLIPRHSKSVRDFWREKSLTEHPGSHLDNQMMAAILCLNKTHGANNSLCEQPTAKDEKRFNPNLYLSKAFLERESLMFDKIVSALRLNYSRLPPQLLVGLGVSVLRRIRRDLVKVEGAYALFNMIVQMLSDGPRPSLASPLIREFIIEVPRASNWHQYLLSTHHLNRLQPQHAEDFIESLSSGILDKLRLQQEKEKSDSGHAITESLIQVSTVKSVEQLLRADVFTTPDKAVTILSSILSHSSNIEIQVAAIKALTGLLADSGSSVDVLRLLEQYAVPIASALNERHPETESEWKSAKLRGELPLVDHSPEGHPVLGILMPRKHKPCSDEMLQLATKALRISSHTNSRWLAMFMNKYGLDGELSMLPHLPACPEVFLNLLRQRGAHKISTKDFITIRDYVLFLLDQPKNIREFTNYVKQNRKLAGSNAGRHWLHLWNKSSKEALDLGGGWAAEMLNWTTANQDNQKSSALLALAEDFVLRIAEIALVRGDLPLFDDIISRIPTNDPKIGHGNSGSGRVIKQLIERIDGLRTPQWQADHNRRPLALPSTLPLRLRLIDLSYGNIEAVSKFAEMIVELLREATTGGRLYHEEFEIIQSHLKTRVPDQFMSSLAVALGSVEKLDSWTSPTVADHLRARLAVQLVDWDKLNEDNDNDNDVKEKTGSAIWDMLNKWRTSPVEEFRNLARQAYPPVHST